MSDLKRFQLVKSESCDWYVIPEGRSEEFWKIELKGKIPKWAEYVQDAECITFTEWK
jgi:hypothetical protein